MTRALDTLHRLERRAHWTSLPMAFPSLPDDYPPPLPANLDPGDIAYDKVSEWVGDAFVEAAIFERMYLSGQVNSDACSVLRSKDVLSRLGVLYGLQRLPHVKPRPLMNTICDLFEVLVTYVWQDRGQHSIGWRNFSRPGSPNDMSRCRQLQAVGVPSILRGCWVGTKIWSTTGARLLNG
ncbi:hypothetical protein C8F01DRAFT_6980 [Mycena amicta]|nr:hypothetical protein C8F01DRAFT_6980 [Mycena amicta]